MTSNQSLHSKLPSKKDFKISLLSAVVPAIISFIAALIVCVFIPLGTITYEGDIAQVRKNYTLLMISDNGVNLGILFVAMGMLFAFFSFAFKMKRKTVNVYYSLAVSRKTMFSNRVIASVIGMAVSLILPIITDAVINIFCFGHTGYIIGCSATLFAECFTFELVGFVLMTVAMVLCHTFVESLLFGISLASLPTVIFSTINVFLISFLKGYNGSSFLIGDDSSIFADNNLVARFAFLNPVYFSKRMIANSTLYDNFFSFLQKYADDNDMFVEIAGTVPRDSYEKIGIEFIAPVMIWFAVSVCLLFVAKRLFVKSKAENAGIHASTPLIGEFFAIQVGLIVFNVWMYYAYIPSLSNTLMYIIGLLLLVVSYFIIILISKRTIRLKPASYICAGATSVATIVLFVILTTGGLGYSSYVPDSDDVDWATLTYANMNMSCAETSSIIGVNGLFVESYDEPPFGYFSDEQDVQNVIKINEKIVQTDTESDVGIGVYYKLKNGKSVKRYYSSIDVETQKMLLSLTDSNAFKDELVYFLSDSDDAPVTNSFNDDYWDASMFFGDSDEVQLKKLFEKGSVGVINANNDYTEFDIKNTPEFRQALLKDLLDSNYEQRFMSKEKAVGAVNFYYDYDENSDDYFGDAVSYISYDPYYYIYEYMENTINYLKSTGEYKYFDHTVNGEIQSVSVEKVSNIVDKMDTDFYYTNMTRIFYSTYLYDASEEYADEYILPEIEYFNHAEKITDQKQIAELINHSNYFGFADDDAYLICVNYENGTKQPMLLSSQSIPDFIK